jgi:hypothetical protein
LLLLAFKQSGRITGRVKRGDALIDVVYAPGKGQLTSFSRFDNRHCTTRWDALGAESL